MKEKSKSILILFIIGLSIPSCVSVKAYQKALLNDSEMALSDKKIESFEINFLEFKPVEKRPISAQVFLTSLMSLPNILRETASV